ncbi:MAG: serine hydrolase [Gemmatimonadetes bacterium]|nr:serine hydrolase [Gemmatimonadota bacterium]
MTHLVSGSHRRAFALSAIGAFGIVGALLAGTATPAAAQGAARGVYYPPAGDAWERRSPAQVGLTARAVDSAVAIAKANESTAPRDQLESQRRSFGREPFGEGVGPFRERGDATGIIIRGGYIVAEWGNPNRVEMTHSVTKSFLTTTIGLAFDRKMIGAITDPVRDYVAPVVALKGPPSSGSPLVTVPPSDMGRAGLDAASSKAVAFDAFEMLEPFESEHNRKITWEHLLRQTSDWQGTLWGKPDWADRPSRDTANWQSRNLSEPGTVFEYNDVRVNLMALASLSVWRRPLPQVLKEFVMDPIGASPTWRWYGYDNSWIVMDGQLTQSVSGGGHWGGGMIISARDMARFGLLTLHNGKWGTRQLISEEWIRMSKVPGPANNTYGFANYYLNTGKRPLPSAPEQAFYHVGNGSNLVYVDPVNDLVIVARWLNSTRSLDAMVKVLTAK